MALRSSGKKGYSYIKGPKIPWKMFCVSVLSVELKGFVHEPSSGVFKRLM